MSLRIVLSLSRSHQPKGLLHLCRRSSQSTNLSLTPVAFLCEDKIKVNELELGVCKFRMGHLSEASVIASSGGTIVHASVNSQSPEELKEDFLPLTVDYRSRDSAFGKLPNNVQKKERHPSVEETLASRFIDRAIRPLFPKGYVNEIQVIVTSHSADGIHDPTVLGVNAASLAVLSSRQPWHGPIGCVRVGMIDGSLKVNPTVTEMQNSILDLLYAGTASRAVMIEVGGAQIPESTIKSALALAHSEVQRIVAEQKRLITEKPPSNLIVGKKSGYTVNDALYTVLKTEFYQQALNLYSSEDHIEIRKKDTRSELEGAFRAKLVTFVESLEVWKELHQITKAMTIDKLIHEAFREVILRNNEKLPDDVSILARSDGRRLQELRPIDCAVDVLPATHGSSYFSRGDTHVLCSTTIGSALECREYYPISGIRELTKGYFFLHYDFPPYSTGEIDSLTTPNRRMIGHGALAEKALRYVMPPFEKFPYTVRVVSECTSSNGSSSMASACAGSLSLRSAGVPILDNVAGISMGLVTDTSYEGEDGIPSGNYRILTDILGSEDHHGDMDFKIAGTVNGITAIQLDVKLAGGIPLEILYEAMDKAQVARLQILAKMAAPTIIKPDTPVQKTIPAAALITVDPDRVGHVIGPNGDMLKSIENVHEVEVDIDDNIFYVYGNSAKGVAEAKAVIEDIGIIVKANDLFPEAMILEVKDYGLIVRINRSQLGLLHVSELTHDPEILKQPLPNFFKKGQKLPVVVTSVDSISGLIKVSRRALLTEAEVSNSRDTELWKVIETVVSEDEFQSATAFKTQIEPPKKWAKSFFQTNIVKETDKREGSLVPKELEKTALGRKSRQSTNKPEKQGKHPLPPILQSPSGVPIPNATVFAPEVSVPASAPAPPLASAPTASSTKKKERIGKKNQKDPLKIAKKALQREERRKKKEEKSSRFLKGTYSPKKDGKASTNNNQKKGDLPPSPVAFLQPRIHSFGKSTPLETEEVEPITDEWSKPSPLAISQPRVHSFGDSTPLGMEDIEIIAEITEENIREEKMESELIEAGTTKNATSDEFVAKNPDTVAENKNPSERMRNANEKLIVDDTQKLDKKKD